MRSLSRSIPPFVAALLVASCSGSSGGDAANTITLAVTDAANDELSMFVIGLDAVQLYSLSGGTIDILPEQLGVDFVALSELARVLNVAVIPEDVYTGVDVTLNFDNASVVVNGETIAATLLDADGAPLVGTLSMPIEFAAPITFDGGNHLLEIDLDLVQSVDVDAGSNTVYVEPTVLARVNRNDPKEHAIGGDLRFVNVDERFFRIDLPADPGDPNPIATVRTGSNTVFQVDGVCMLGTAGLAAIEALAPGTWVQAFGSMDASSAYFSALTVEAGAGSYNGGTDIVEGLIIGRDSGAGTDTQLTVLGHSNYDDHTSFQFNLQFFVNTSFANTKVVRRGSSQVYDTDELNVGQRVRVFGVLDPVTHVVSADTATDVIRVEPTRVAGFAAAAPTSNTLTIDLQRVDLRDQSAFTWSESGINPPLPTNFVIGDPNNLGPGQSITAGTPVEAIGFFAPVDAAGADFVASILINRELLASAFLIRDRANGMTVTPSFGTGQIDFTFSGTPDPLEKAVVDQGFVGEIDVTGTGITIEQNGLIAVGLYSIRDRTLNTVSIFLTFNAFSQALDAALTGGATIYNFGAIGVYDSGASTVNSALIGVVLN